jgi:hypothetical protein
MPINATWHQAHPMPPRATFEERARWHLEHVQVCGCRKIPRVLGAQMRERGMLPEGVPVDE